MSKFKFPEVAVLETKKKVISDQMVCKIDAIVLFRTASNTSFSFSKESYEMSFVDKNEISFRDLMEWIAAYYHSNNNG